MGSRINSIFQLRQRGPAAQFESVVSPHLGRLYRLACRFTGSREDAEDLLQDLCVRMLPRLGELQDLDQPGPWLARALHNLFIDRLRRQARSPVEVVEDPPEPESDQPGPLQQAINRATAEGLQRALDQLPAEQRAVIAWHDIEGYTLEELSSARDLPLGTLKSRLHRARRALRARLVEPFPAPGRVGE